MFGEILGAVASNVIGSALGGGEQTPSQATIPGVKFQPVTYTGATGTVTGSPEGDFGYNWSADVAPWITELGDLGSQNAMSLFSQYLGASQVDPYAAAQEYYSRGLGMLEPEIAKQRNALAGNLFGSGRLGLKIAGEGAGYGAGAGAINPDIAGFGTGVGKAYTNLYANALTAGQDLQTNYINQLNKAANQMFTLGMKPAEIEQALINFTKDLEASRSNALKEGVQSLTPQETPQSVFAGEAGQAIGGMFGDWVNNQDFFGTAQATSGPF